MRQQNHNHDDNDYNNYNNNYINTAPGVLFTCEEMERIKNAYLDNISDRIPAAVAVMIERAIDHGLTCDEIVMAIEETGFAPYPSPRYLQKVLENWAENGVTVSRIKHSVSANRASAWWKTDRMHWDI